MKYDELVFKICAHNHLDLALDHLFGGGGVTVSVRSDEENSCFVLWTGLYQLSSVVYCLEIAG